MSHLSLKHNHISVAEASNPTKPYKNLFNMLETWEVATPPQHTHARTHTTKHRGATVGENWRSQQERGTLVNRRPPTPPLPACLPASDANELPVLRLHRASAAG